MTSLLLNKTKQWTPLKLRNSVPKKILLRGLKKTSHRLREYICNINPRNCVQTVYLKINTKKAKEDLNRHCRKEISKRPVSIRTGVQHSSSWGKCKLQPWGEMSFTTPGLERWECKLVQPLWRTVWRFLKKLKLEIFYDSTIPLMGIYPEKTIIQKSSLQHYLQ